MGDRQGSGRGNRQGSGRGAGKEVKGGGLGWGGWPGGVEGHGGELSGNYFSEDGKKRKGTYNAQSTASFANVKSSLRNRKTPLSPLATTWSSVNCPVRIRNTNHNFAGFFIFAGEFQLCPIGRIIHDPHSYTQALARARRARERAS